ncbi:hypothetical protein PIB30_026955 [Stylosanthes scabra]|uniref:Uncharacterized protein n=1 Tax=Stylosanthes scabra TaxID=79078 RepID=A0ABU6ZBW0_9FABA|nr:hypothetical protein [Stylosanthes scabra]
MLWSQVPSKEINKLQIVIPATTNTEIRRCWDRRLSASAYPHCPILKARGKFPVVALAFVFGKMMKYQSVEMHLSIESSDVHYAHQPSHSFKVAEDHVLLCDLQVLFSDEEWKTLDACVGHDNEWKSVKVKFVPYIIPVQCGVFVYKEETSMKDILFDWSYDMKVSDYETVNTSSWMRLVPSWTFNNIGTIGRRKRRLSSADEELAVIARFSESLQRVVENLKRLMAPREEDQCLSLMQQDTDEEDEGEEGESVLEA